MPISLFGHFAIDTIEAIEAIFLFLLSTTMATKSQKWTDDPLREQLKQDILDGFIPAGMTASKAQSKRTEYEKMGKLFAGRLTGMRKIIAKNGGQEKKPKGQRWDKKNLVRQQLKTDLAVGFIPGGTDAESAWKMRAVYEAIEPVELWKSRYNSMVKMVMEGQVKALEDANDLYMDRLLHPREQYNARGEPEWVEHEAKDLLSIDMDEGLHKQMTKQELYNSRMQYQDFTLETFRGHVYQEEQTRKWREQWTDGRKEYALVQPTN